MAVAAERGRGRHRRENEGEVNAKREEGEVVKDRENNNYSRQNGCQDIGRKGRRDELEANPPASKTSSLAEKPLVSFHFPLNVSKTYFNWCVVEVQRTGRSSS